MLIAMQSELLYDLSTSNDDNDFPKYLNMRFDFNDVLLESVSDDEVRVKFPLGVSMTFFTFTSLFELLFSIFGAFFLCRMREIKIIKIITAKIAPLPIAMSSKSPCDLPSIDTFGTES